MFSRHYHSELSFLREMGRGFAEAHPNTAGMLGERGGDPDVERLLEGFAFLAARIRERLDDEVPELVHELCGLLLPHFLRTIPACSVVEFSPQLSAVRGRQRVGAGTELSTAPIDRTACRFRTTQALDLLPLAIQDVVLEGPQSTTPQLRLVFQTTKAGFDHVFCDEGIRLFLHGEFAVAMTLRLWFQRHCRRVQVRPAGGRGPGVSLDPAVVRCLGFGEQEGMLPWPRLAPPGFRFLQEYFALPQKFLFLDLQQLSAAREAADERFEVLFSFDRPPELPGRLGPESIRLHCVPVINLFAGSAEPIRGAVPGGEHLLRPAGVSAAHSEVYSVDGVQGVRRGAGTRTTYVPFFAFGHVRDQGRQAFFRLRREVGPAGDGLDTYLSLGSARDVTPSLEDEVLSVELTCTNRALAGRVRAGEISVPTATSPAHVRFKNILPTTKPVLPPLGSELHWRLVGHLALGHRSLLDVEPLRALLSAYDFQGAADPQARSCRGRIDAIQSVEARPARRLLEGAALRGTGVRLELDEAAFASRGEATLFCDVLDELLASRVTLNSFSELTVRLQPSRTEYAWAPRNGSQTLL